LAPEEGDAASLLLSWEFTAHTGEKVVLRNVNARGLVVYFYPRAMTPGCTREAARFNELLDEFKRCGVEVYGVSTDPPERNRRFAEKLSLRFKLLSDPQGELASRLGILRGGKRPSAERVTYIIIDGRVVATLRGVRPAEKHADLALEEVRRHLQC